MDKSKILIVEDEGLVAKDIKDTLTDLGYEVVGITGHGDRAIELTTEKKPDLVLMDIMLKGLMDGTEAAAVIRKNNKIPVVFLTANSDDSTLNKAKLTEPFGFIIKPFNSRDLYTTIEMSLYKRSMEKKLEDLSEERLQLLESEKKFRLEAEAANRSKDVFLAMVSHELRTPLTTILGWTHIIKKNMGNSEKLLQGINIIERSVLSQETLVNDLLDSSRIVQGNLVINNNAEHLSEIIKSTIVNLSPIFDDKKIVFTINLTAKEDLVSGDADRLRQIFSNLLTNSKKFTPENGKMTITTRNTNMPSNPNTKCISAEFKDNGIGISPEFLPLIFNRFTQETHANSKIHGGLGLGLSIVKNLIELHKGEIIAHSDGLNKGTSFTVYIPLISS